MFPCMVSLLEVIWKHRKTESFASANNIPLKIKITQKKKKNLAECTVNQTCNCANYEGIIYNRPT